MSFKLLNVDNNPKTVKGNRFGYLTGILYLAPHTLSGQNLCLGSSPGCRSDCLYFSGRGFTNKVQQARLRKTKLFLESREQFERLLYDDIRKLSAKAKEVGSKPCVRLNGTSDINFGMVFPSLYSDFEDVLFYDYTKIKSRITKYLRGDYPKNYYLLYSRHERNHRYCKSILNSGVNVAVVFRDELPKTYLDHDVISGDDHDLRFLDPSPVVIGLKAKGRARSESTGFVV